MTAVNGSHQANASMVGLTHLFSAMSQDFGDGVVRKALTGQLQVSGETRAAFRRAVGSYVSVDGFRNSELAPPPLLQEQVAHWARYRDDLAGAVIKVWVELQQPLRERVDAYLRERGLLNGEPDYSTHRISVVEPDSNWTEAVDGLAEENPDISKDDLLLMSAYLGGRVTQAPDEEAESPSGALRRLRCRWSYPGRCRRALRSAGRAGPRCWGVGAGSARVRCGHWGDEGKEAG